MDGMKYMPCPLQFHFINCVYTDGFINTQSLKSQLSVLLILPIYPFLWFSERFLLFIVISILWYDYLMIIIVSIIIISISILLDYALFFVKSVEHRWFHKCSGTKESVSWPSWLHLLFPFLEFSWFCFISDAFWCFEPLGSRYFTASTWLKIWAVGLLDQPLWQVSDLQTICVQWQDSMHHICNVFSLFPYKHF